jgi:hypothetical protein
MTTTWRQDAVNAIVAILQDEATANPTLLRKVYSSRPGSFGETPVAYVGPRSESIAHDSGTRTRTFDGLTVTIVDQTGDLLDNLVDNLVDRFDLFGNVQRVGSSIIELASVSDVDISVDGPDKSILYRGVVFSFGRTFKMEGRDATSKIAHLNPATATPEAITNAIVASGLPGTYPSPASSATAEAVVLALQAAGYIVGVLTAATATGELICTALIAAGLMDPA